MTQYWIVGARVQDEDRIDQFVKHGFWYADAEGAQQKIQDIQVGDRLAIKRMLLATAEVGIRAVGEVLAFEDYKFGKEAYRMVYVKWIRLAQERRVPFKGLGSAIHGPFFDGDPLIAGVFVI